MRRVRVGNRRQKHFPLVNPLPSRLPVRALVSALSLCLATSFLQGAETSPEAISALLKEKIGPHPRLILRAGEEEVLKRKIKSDPVLAEISAGVLAEAEKILTVPTIAYVKKGRRLESFNKEGIKRISHLGIAWRLTGDIRFRDRARTELLAMAGAKDWNPSHFLDTAMATEAVAIGYDWFFNSFDEATRETLKKALIEKGINPSFAGKHTWIDCDMNWSQVCHDGMTMGALAIAEDEPELAARVISRAVENVPRAMDVYGPDGAFPEGPSYWTYGTTHNVLFLSALESALGTDFGLSQIPGFLDSSDYMVHVTGPTGLFHNYADCNQRTGAIGAMYWFAAKREAPSCLWFEMQQSGAGLKQKKSMKYGPFVLIWAAAPLKAMAPQALDWVGGGRTPVAFFRSGWDRDALFVGIKGGSPSTNHAHMDVGSFVFDALGVRWALDLGLQDYNSLESRGIKLWGREQNSERWRVFRLSNSSHNMSVINDQLQSVQGNATFVATGLNASSPQAVVDCSSIFAGQAEKVVRTFSFPERRALVVDDSLQDLAVSGTVRWQMVTEADVTISGAEAVLRQAGKTLRVRCLNPGKGTWSVVDISNPRSDFDASNPGAKLLVFSLPVQAGDSPRITVQLTP
jgi:hypothetical protein